MVDVQELDAFVRSGVQTIARRLNVEQTPQLLPSSEILGDRAKDTTLRLHEGRMDAAGVAGAVDGTRHRDDQR